MYIKILRVTIWLDTSELWVGGGVFCGVFLLLLFSEFSVMDLKIMSLKHEFQTSSLNNQVLRKISFSYVDTS